MAAGDVIVTFDPSAYVTEVVVEPSLLLTEVEDAPLSACNNGSETLVLLEPLVPLASLDPSELAT